MAKVIAEYRTTACPDCITADAGYSEEETGVPYSTEHPPLSRISDNATIDVTNMGDADETIEPHFSSSPCGTCGDPLGGDRYDVTVTEWA